MPTSGAAGLAGDLKGYLFRGTRGRTRQLTTNPLAQADVYRMIRRRAFGAGIRTRIGNHTFRAIGITQYLRNRGRRELAQQMAARPNAAMVSALSQRAKNRTSALQRRWSMRCSLSPQILLLKVRR